MTKEWNSDDSDLTLEQSARAMIKFLQNTLKMLRSRSHVTVVILVFISYAGIVTHYQANQIINRTGGQPGKQSNSKFKQLTANDSISIAEFSRRRKLIKSTCERYGAYTSREKVRAKMLLDKEAESSTSNPGIENNEQIWSLLKKASHHQFFVQKEKKLMWCKVPKAASTSWLFAFLSLAHVPMSEIPEDNGMGLHAFLREKYPMLTKNLFKKMLPQTIKFLVARHPFERVISAYVDKLENYTRDVEYRGGYYYAMYGHDIVSTYRHKYKLKFPENPLFDRREPSFLEFVEYLIDTPLEKFDEHWKPIFILCPPCHFSFDIIIKMETFKEDTNFLLNQRDLDVNILARKHQAKGSDGKELAKRLFSQVPKRMVESLHEKYRVDFDMFEYDLEEYIELAASDSD